LPVRIDEEISNDVAWAPAASTAPCDATTGATDPSGRRAQTSPADQIRAYEEKLLRKRSR